MSHPAGELPEDARAIIAEEEALLGRVLASLEAARHRSTDRKQESRGLTAQLQVLRDEAATAPVADLPHLLHQMNQVRALLERQEGTALPEVQAPYFAHLRLHGVTGIRDYLLGRTSFADVSADVRIIDWRFAPVARVFYRYGEGDAYEEWFGERLSEGTVEVRRLVVIERGVLTRIQVGTRVLARTPEGPWRLVGSGPSSQLAGGTGTAVRPGSLGVGQGAARREGALDVTALLDAEQFEAVSVNADQPLLVLGSAGSGKTTVALHRLAKIAFDDHARYPESRMKVIVPEEGLARLSRRLLAPLGLGKVSVETLDAWATTAARVAFGAKSFKLWEDPPPLVSKLKRHPALRRALAARVGVLKSNATTLPRLRKRLAELFTDRRFLEGVVSYSRGDLPLTVVEETVRHTMLQIATPLSRELEGIDPEHLQTLDGKSMESDTPDELAGTLDLEDLPLLLFLRSQGGNLGAVGRLVHLVLDEAEDFSLIELFVLGRLMGEARSCTLAGDEMQQTTTSFAGWPAVLTELGIRDAATLRLQVAYRCPRPVTELARTVLGPLAPVATTQAGREGAPVGFHHFPDEAQAHLFIGEALRDLLEREPHASVGVIASNPEQARALHRVVSDMSWARLVLGGEFTFEPGVDVTDVENVKGLEFDYVVIPDATARAYPANDEARRRLHIAVTRTSHQLWVVSAGVRSPLLVGA
ncbi:ATP-binding domain-containing protein [Archangium sp.]|uniref:ATP-binding domain-containing protein n=1 Tax=Archangium sp. TaxID=1872627 RepID=UPI002869F213|nr:ATP-binding domain-containing protein [Archangium sp.]